MRAFQVEAVGLQAQATNWLSPASTTAHALLQVNRRLPDPSDQLL